MKRSRIAMLGLPFLIGFGVLVSACSLTSDRGLTPALEYGMPYGSVDLVGWR